MDSSQAQPREAARDKCLQFRYTTHKLLEVNSVAIANESKRPLTCSRHVYSSIFEKEDNPTGNKNWEQFLDTQGSKVSNVLSTVIHW